MPEPTYARRDQLAAAVRTMPNTEHHHLRGAVAATIEDVLRTFDEFARRLDTIEARRPEMCTTCAGRGWLAHQTYGYAELPPDAIPVQACGACRQFTSDIDAARAAIDAQVTPGDWQSGGYTKDGEGLEWVDPVWLDNDTGERLTGRTPGAGELPGDVWIRLNVDPPALPAWLATEPPCWRCGEPPEAHEEDHEHEPAAVAAITVTYYVTAGPAAGPGDARENVRAIFDNVHDNSTALEALREGLAYADTPAFLAGTSSPELAP